MVSRRVFASLAAGLGLAAVMPGLALAQPSMPTGSGGSDGSIDTPLTAMPSGRLTPTGHEGMQQLHLNAVGLTPSSTHEVDLVQGGCNTRMSMGRVRGVMPIGTITADAGGAVNTMVSAPRQAMRTHGSLLILLGSGSMGSDGSMVVACASLRGHGSALRDVSQGAMRPSGQAQLSYDPGTRTLTVRVHASGFAPGSMHAAHVHQGTCQAQGPVVYMLQDLSANRDGVIDATRTVSGVMNPPPATGWYLNIHLGNSNAILAGGQPTLQFQPLLCGDIAGTSGAVGMPTHGQVTTSHGEQFLSPGQTDVKIMTVGSFTFTASCTSVQSDGQAYTQAAFNVVSSQAESDLDGGGPVPAGQSVNIHTDSDLVPNPQGMTPATPALPTGTFDQSPSASTSTEIAPDGTEVDIFYSDGVNLDGHACFAGAVGFTS